MIERTPHKVMGAFTGMFYRTMAGARMYLAHRRKKDMNKRKYAWLIEVSVLEKCRAAGITAVGVLWKEGKVRHVHLTHIDDFFGPNSFHFFGDTKQRGLPMKFFRIDPSKSVKVISIAVRLR